MKKIVIVIAGFVWTLSAYGQFYSIDKGNTVKNSDTVSDITEEYSICDNEYIIDNSYENAETTFQGCDAVLPLKNIRITSPYGLRRDPFTGKTKFHKGIDLYAKHEFPVAMMTGKVIKTGYNKIAGHYVTLQHGKLTVSYCHLSKIYVHKNEVVFPGTIIGLTGSTGRSSREHLHLTIRLNGNIINPIALLKLLF